MADLKFAIKFNASFDAPLNPGYTYEIREYGATLTKTLAKGDGVLGTEVDIQVDAVKVEKGGFLLAVVAIPVGGSESDQFIANLGTFSTQLVTEAPTKAAEQTETAAPQETSIAAVKLDDTDIESFTMQTGEEGDISAAFQVIGDSSLKFDYSIFVVVNKEDTGKHLVSGSGTAGQTILSPIDLSVLPSSDKYQLRLDIKFTEGKAGMGQAFTPAFSHVNTNTVSTPQVLGTRSYFVPIMITVGVPLAALFFFAKWKSKAKKKNEKGNPRIKVPSYSGEKETPQKDE